MLIVVAVVCLWASTAHSQDSATLEDVTEIIETFAGDHHCGHVCTEDRREGAPDRSEYTVTHDEAVMIADAILQAHEQVDDVSVAILLAVAYRESSFFRYAVGGGGECGLWQQSPRYARPEESLIELGCEERGHCDREAREAVCDWLQDPYSGALAFALSVERKLHEYGESRWACHYNRGSDCDVEGMMYQEATDRMTSMMEHNLHVMERRRDELASSEDESEGNSSSQ